MAVIAAQHCSSCLERQIKSLSSDGSLAKARIVHFATHGLLAGESEQILKAKAEPGLILTPPDKASELDDGLLTASEITLLKLDAHGPLVTRSDIHHQRT